MIELLKNGERYIILWNNSENANAIKVTRDDVYMLYIKLRDEFSG